MDGSKGGCAVAVTGLKLGQPHRFASLQGKER